MSKLGGEGTSPPFSIAPKSFLESPIMTMPVLSCLSLEESYPSLANQSSTQGQAGWSNGDRGGAPGGRISFVSLGAYGPKIFLLSLSHGRLQLLKPGRAVPNTGQGMKLRTVYYKSENTKVLQGYTLSYIEKLFNFIYFLIYPGCLSLPRLSEFF